MLRWVITVDSLLCALLTDLRNIFLYRPVCLLLFRNVLQSLLTIPSIELVDQDWNDDAGQGIRMHSFCVLMAKIVCTEGAHDSVIMLLLAKLFGTGHPARGGGKGGRGNTGQKVNGVDPVAHIKYTGN